MFILFICFQDPSLLLLPEFMFLVFLICLSFLLWDCFPCVLAFFFSGLPPCMPYVLSAFCLCFLSFCSFSFFPCLIGCSPQVKDNVV